MSKLRRNVGHLILALAVALLSSDASLATVREGYIGSWVAANGGCKAVFGALGRVPLSGDRFLDLTAVEWSNDLIQEYEKIYTACMIEVNTPRGVRPNVAIINPMYEEAGQRKAEEVRQRFVEPARAEIQRQETQQSLRQKMSEELSQRNAQRLKEKAELDSEAAEIARERVAKEGPILEELTKRAEQAQRDRSEAEKRLAEVRSKIESAERQIENARRSTQTANDTNANEVRQQTNREIHSRLPARCAVRLEQFKNVNLGTSLVDLELQLGCKATPISSDRIVGEGTFSTYRWEGRNSGTYLVTVFRNSRLESKSQLGLD